MISSECLERNSEALKNAWRHLLLTIVFNDEDDKWDFEGFSFTEKEAVFSELLEYVKTRNVSLDKTNLEEIINIDDNVLIIESMSDSELIETVTQNGERFWIFAIWFEICGKWWKHFHSKFWHF